MDKWACVGSLMQNSHGAGGRFLPRSNHRFKFSIFTVSMQSWLSMFWWMRKWQQSIEITWICGAPINYFIVVLKKEFIKNSYVWGKLRTQWIGETHSIETPSIFLVGFLRVMCPFRRLAAAVFFNLCDINSQPARETFGCSISTWRTTTTWPIFRNAGVGKGTNHHDSQQNLDEHWCPKGVPWDQNFWSKFFFISTSYDMYLRDFLIY